MVNHYPESVDVEAMFEHGLPEYLQKDLDDFKEGEKTNCSYLDCLWCELYGSINVALTDNEITQYHAEYLRKKFLGIDPR